MLAALKQFEIAASSIPARREQPEVGVEPALLVAVLRVIAAGGLRHDAATAVAASVWQQLPAVASKAGPRQVHRFAARLGTRSLSIALDDEDEGWRRVVLARWLAEAT